MPGIQNTNLHLLKNGLSMTFYINVYFNNGEVFFMRMSDLCHCNPKILVLYVLKYLFYLNEEDVHKTGRTRRWTMDSAIFFCY